jgi:uncharacterized protein (TIGR03435 family)
MRTLAALTLILLLWICAIFAQSPATQPAFAVASIKPNPHTLGKDAEMRLAFNPAGVSGHNLTLKQMIVEAYDLQPYQVSGGPKWLDNDEYDIDARADGPASKAQLRGMLRTLLVERFGLAIHSETKELSVYELMVDKSGPKIHATADSGHPASTGARGFHGDMREFANLLSVKLNIPALADPGRPGIASGSPTPVVDKTGLSGIYDFNVEVKLEIGVDMFVLWQRALQDQLGLKLEARKSKVEVWVVERAARVPAVN